MNVEIGTEAPIFLFWEYLYQIVDIFSLQCVSTLISYNYYSIIQYKSQCIGLITNGQCENSNSKSD